MPMQTYDIVGSYNNQRVVNIDAERSINMFEYLDEKGKKNKSLLSTSGIKNTGVSFPSAANGFRGQFVFGNNMYMVIGNNVYLVNSSLTPSKLNSTSLEHTVGYVGIDANTYQIIFVDGSNGYIYDTNTGVFSVITDPAFPTNPIDVCYLDGFFVVASGGTNNFVLSTFNQGLVWGPDNVGTESTFSMAGSGNSNIVITYATGGSISNYQVGTPVYFSPPSMGNLPIELPAGIAFYVKSQVSSVGNTTITVSATDGGTAITSSAGGSGTITNQGQLQLGSMTSHPGTIVACRTLHRRLFLFSQYFTEVWFNQGIGTNLPFRPDRNLNMEVGTVSISSICLGFDRMFFLSQDRDGLSAVKMTTGTEAEPISTRALDFALAQYAATPGIGVSDAWSELIKENGLIFYRLNFTNADHTYVFNVSMSDRENLRWHEEQTLTGDRHRAQTHAYFNGVNYYGDYANPILYTVDPSYVTNYNPITTLNEPIYRARIGKPVGAPSYERIRIDRFHLDVVQGYVPDPTTNQAPTIYLSYSKNGGITYGPILTYTTPPAGNPLVSNMGQIGQYSYRSVWRKLGVVPRGQFFVPKVEFYSEVPFTILGAAWSFEFMPE